MSERMDAAVPGDVLVAELALRLHQEGTVGLHVEVPTGSVLTESDLQSGCKLVDTAAIDFDSLSARNVIVASVAFRRACP